MLLQFIFIAAYGLDGFSHAVETLVGQAVGARNRAALRRAAWMGGFWSGLTALLITLAFVIAHEDLIALMTTSEPVREVAGFYAIYVMFIPVAAFGTFLIDGIFVGATRARDMRNMMALSTVIYLVMVALLMPSQDNHGLWLAFFCSFMIRGVTLALRYPRLEREIFS